MLTAAYLINRTPTKLLNGKTPYEALFNQKPSYDHLKVFGSLCYAHNRLKGHDKFASRSRKCIFMGYPYGKKAWKLFDLNTNEYFESSNVVFHESTFLFQNVQLRVINGEEKNSAQNSAQPRFPDSSIIQPQFTDWTEFPSRWASREEDLSGPATVEPNSENTDATSAEPRLENT